MAVVVLVSDSNRCDTQPEHNKGQSNVCAKHKEAYLCVCKPLLCAFQIVKWLGHI